jgi:hypothetical protein
VIEELFCGQIARLPQEDKRMIWAGNAVEFFKLE